MGKALKSILKIIVIFVVVIAVAWLAAWAFTAAFGTITAGSTAAGTLNAALAAAWTKGVTFAIAGFEITLTLKTVAWVLIGQAVSMGMSEYQMETLAEQVEAGDESTRDQVTDHIDDWYADRDNLWDSTFNPDNTDPDGYSTGRDGVIDDVVSNPDIIDITDTPMDDDIDESDDGFPPINFPEPPPTMQPPASGDDDEDVDRIQNAAVGVAVTLGLVALLGS